MSSRKKRFLGGFDLNNFNQLNEHAILNPGKIFSFFFPPFPLFGAAAHHPASPPLGAQPLLPGDQGAPCGRPFSAAPRPPRRRGAPPPPPGPADAPGCACPFPPSPRPPRWGISNRLLPLPWFGGEPPTRPGFPSQASPSFFFPLPNSLFPTAPGPSPPAASFPPLPFYPAPPRRRLGGAGFPRRPLPGGPAERTPRARGAPSSPAMVSAPGSPPSNFPPLGGIGSSPFPGPPGLAALPRLSRPLGAFPLPLSLLSGARPFLPRRFPVPGTARGPRLPFRHAGRREAGPKGCRPWARARGRGRGGNGQHPAGPQGRPSPGSRHGGPSAPLPRASPGLE